MNRLRAIVMLALCTAMLALCATSGYAQSSDDGAPIPILTGYSGFFTKVNGGQVTDTPGTTPLLLMPVGDKWLLEAKGSYSDNFKRLTPTGPWAGTMSYGLSYGQIDYIANPYVTVTAGRFVTPFGVYSERYSPTWIRALQNGPIISGVTRVGSNGGMLRGGFPLSSKVNLNYASYFSTVVTNHIVSSDRTAGGRVGIYLPGPRIELGTSYQRSLMVDARRYQGVHAIWQPNAFPLSLRSEYAWAGDKGAGYWIESAYRLSQIPHGQPIEIVGRAQQYFGGSLTAAAAAKAGVPQKDTQGADFGINYYLPNDVRVSGGYGRQFSTAKDTNIWSVGLTYRFVWGLGPRGTL